MDKNLKYFYIFLTITFILVINIFSSLFINLNNNIDNLSNKIILSFDKNKYKEINFYKNKGTIIIMFDDGWKSQYNIGYKYMKEKNMAGSISIIPSTIGSFKYMNLNDLYNVYNSGWDLLNHTYSHCNLDDLDYNKQLKEIDNAYKWLNKYGFTRGNNILIYPEGIYNKDTFKIMNKLNYISGRSVNNGFNSLENLNLYNINVFNILSTTSLKETYNKIDYTINNNLNTIILFHKLETKTKSFMDYEIDNFYKIINYIDNRRNKINIITYSDWVQIILKYKNNY